MPEDFQSKERKERLQERRAEQDRIRDQQAKRYRQVQELNQDPLNQAALRWLRLTDETISEATQHCLQLMQWGLSQGLGFPDRRQTDMFEATLDELDAQSNQQSLLSYLKGPKDEPNLTEPELLKASDKHQAAWLLIDGLDSRLQSEPDNNGIYPPQYPLRLPGD